MALFSPIWIMCVYKVNRLKINIDTENALCQSDKPSETISADYAENVSEYKAIMN